MEAPAAEVEAGIKSIVEKDSWIIEGFISPEAKLKLEKADLILYLDYSGPRAAWGGLKRWWQHHDKIRPEMPAGCVEKLDWKYLKVMWLRMERMEIEEAIKGHENKIIRLKSPRKLKKYLRKK